MPVRRGPRAHGARKAAEFIRNAGKELMLTVAQQLTKPKIQTVATMLSTQGYWDISVSYQKIQPLI